MAPGRETLEMSNLRCQRRFKRENKTGQKAMLLHIILEASILISLNVIAFL